MRSEIDLISVLVSAIALLSAFFGMIDWVIALLFVLTQCSVKIRWG
jgi:uncharacterized ion transporter superfamily protein YfcC